MSKNQCDGCRRGLPVDENGHHKGPGRYDLQGCTKHLYEEPAPVTPPIVDPDDLVEHEERFPFE